jgi:hypothetical protein
MAFRTKRHMKRRRKTRRRIFRKKMRGGALEDTIKKIMKFHYDTNEPTFILKKDLKKFGGGNYKPPPHLDADVDEDDIKALVKDEKLTLAKTDEYGVKHYAITEEFISESKSK